MKREGRGRGGGEGVIAEMFARNFSCGVLIMFLNQASFSVLSRE